LAMRLARIEGLRRAADDPTAESQTVATALPEFWQLPRLVTPSPSSGPVFQ
jgi:hypothetical protein